MSKSVSFTKKAAVIVAGLIGLVVAVAHILHGEYIVRHNITQPGVLTVLLMLADPPAFLYLAFLGRKPTTTELLTMQCFVSLLNAVLYASIVSYLVKRSWKTK